MCGIQYTNIAEIDQRNFSDSLYKMFHRGPDTLPAILNIGESKLGHTRLKIIDLDDRSNQPFISRSGKHIIVFNGEIYNYKELSKQFNLQLKTTCDTEVLIELYTLLGPGILKHLNGMFSFVIFDSESHEFFVARDRLGIKPLYYYEENGKYFFASEIASIINSIHNTEIDPIGLRQYQKMRTFFNGYTLYKNIKMFPAGHYMFEGKLTKYWELDYSLKEPPENEELFSLLDTSVNYRCIADVPVGSYLSGGLDSSVLAALSKKNIGDLYTWTVGFEYENEFLYSDLAAEHLKTRHSKVAISPQEFRELARWMIKTRGEPLSVPNEVLLYKMTKEVKKKNTVVLSGEGADELFFGYDRIFRWANGSKWDLKTFSDLYCYGSHDDLEIVEDVISPYLKETPIDTVSNFFQTGHLHGLLRRLDNSTMLNSVEARVPFVDHKIIERLAGVPFQYKMNNGVVKNPLKMVFKDLLPERIVNRSKIGFPVPLSLIFPNFKEQFKTPMDAWLNFNISTLFEKERADLIGSPVLT